MAHHELKCFAKHYQHIVYGNKRSEVRYNDRNFQIGDTVTFKEGQQEIDGFKYTSSQVSARITYIDDFGCQTGYVNLSLGDVGLLRIV